MLAVKGIRVDFGGIAALDDVTLEVPAGQICGIIGPNGAGKTTLFDVIAGERRAQRGRVVLDGRDVTALGADARARLGVRRTFQRVQPFGWLTVEDNVLAALEWSEGPAGILRDMVGWRRRSRERDRRAAVGAALHRCGLEAVRTRCAGGLPVAAARVVEFARATVEPPRLLLLDEPASGLAQVDIDRLGMLIEAVRRDTGCGVLLVEHDAPFVMGLCERVVVLALGSVIADGSPDEISRHPAVREAYLGQGV